MVKYARILECFKSCGDFHTHHIASCDGVKDLQVSFNIEIRFNMNSLNCILIITFLQLVIVSHKGCLCTISCFTCSSRNGSDTDCEDPFHPGPHSYTERCKVPKRGHIGEFPAHFCIKVTGTSDTTHEKLVIRRCVLGNMENQCGKFRLENDTLHGCILTCDLDGCNDSIPLSSNGALTILLLVLSSIYITAFGNGSTSFLSDQSLTKKKSNPSNPPCSPSSIPSNMHIVSKLLVTGKLNHMGSEDVGTPSMGFVVQPL